MKNRTEDTHLVTVNDLIPGRPIPAPIVVKVTDVIWDSVKSRRAEVELVDSVGNPFRLVDFDGANITIEWKSNHRYRISKCSVNEGGGGYELELATSKKTEIVPLGPDSSTTELLVVGDTHVGREEHPGTGEVIDPIGAFSSIVDYGLEVGVDAVIHTGDIFHNTVKKEDINLAKKQVFSRLRKASTPFYYVRGNHGTEAGYDLLTEKTNDYISGLDSRGTAVKDDVRLYGIDHHEMGDIPWNNLNFPEALREEVSVLVLHQTLEQLPGSNGQSVDVKRIQSRAPRQFDFIVSGHHHDASCTKLNGSTVMYTGAAECMSKNKDPIDRVAWLIRSVNGYVTCERYDVH
jgi:predicted phosphodiesterase